MTRVIVYSEREMRVSDLPDACRVNEDGSARVSAATAKQYATSTRRLVDAVGDLPLGELTAEHLLHFQRLTDARVSPVTANAYKRDLRAMLRRVGRPELADVLRLATVRRRRSRAMPEADFARILALASVRDAALLLVLRHTGARRGEVVTMTPARTRLWHNPDGAPRLAAVVSGKAGERLIMTASAVCCQALALWQVIKPPHHSPDYVWTTDQGTALQPQSINSIFRKLRLRAGLPSDHPVYPHALRHRYAQEQLSAFDAKIVSQLMGHASVTTTLDIYAHRSEADLARSVLGEDAPENLLGL